jgi:DNA-binding transcriptional ArsR family regulator
MSPVRQAVLQLVMGLAPVTVAQLEKRMGLERHALYYHLRVLEKCGLIAKHKDDKRRTTYSSLAGDLLFTTNAGPEWKEIARAASHASQRRLMKRMDEALQGEPAPKGSPRKNLGGFITLFLDDEGRGELIEILDRMWDEILAIQHEARPKDKPYFFGFGFAPESYSKDSKDE